MNTDKRSRKITKICTDVLRQVSPCEGKREEILQFATSLMEDLSEQLRSSGIQADVSIQGSIAKDTWLAEEKDLDVFIQLPKDNAEQIFPKVLNVVKSLVGDKWVEAYAEHPYLEAEIAGVKIDFVPAFKIEKATEATSSVDRTPLHTAYVKGHLDQQTKDEVRLLKQFTRGVGTYGAEIKVGGLSGYLCELLILHYGTFLKTLQGITSWKLGEFIDIEQLYGGCIDEAKLLFNAPLMVVDPVDKNRNVAAIISKDRLGDVMLAAELFLKNPAIAFFFPAETVQLPPEALDRRLSMLEYDLVFVLFKVEEVVPDILWGQLLKTANSLKQLLFRNDFQVFRDAIWSDESELIVLVFGLEARTIAPLRRHRGPPADSREVISFIEKYRNDATVIGPWVEEGRWMVGIRRHYIEAVSLLQESLKRGNRIGVASGLVDSVKDAEVIVNNEILDFYSSNEDFAKFLTDFLRGRSKWMEFE